MLAKITIIKELQGNQKKISILSLYFSSLMRFSEANCGKKPARLMQRLRIQSYEYRCSLLYQKKITQLHITKLNIFPLNMTQFSSSLCPTYTSNDMKFLLIFNNRVQKSLTKKQLQKCVLGSYLCVPQESGPTQMAGILPPWPGLPRVRFLQTFKSPCVTLPGGSFQEVKEPAATENEMPPTYFSII